MCPGYVIQSLQANKQWGFSKRALWAFVLQVQDSLLEFDAFNVKCHKWH